MSLPANGGERFNDVDYEHSPLKQITPEERIAKRIVLLHLLLSQSETDAVNKDLEMVELYYQHLTPSERKLHLVYFAKLRTDERTKNEKELATLKKPN